MQFGGYAPSLGKGSNNSSGGRPTTAPSFSDNNRRSVRFAGDLGLDDDDDDDDINTAMTSQRGRPKTAPAASGNKSRNNNNNTNDLLNSSLEDSMNRELFNKKKKAATSVKEDEQSSFSLKGKDGTTGNEKPKNTKKKGLLYLVNGLPLLLI